MLKNHVMEDHPIVLFESLHSTNAYVTAAAEQLPTGLVVVADHQSAGRGRSGRRWVAPAGTALLCSMLVRPNIPPAHLHWLTMIAGVAAVTAIDKLCGLRLQLKWPNDVIAVVDGQWQKVGGILVETGLEADKVTHAVIGIGLNVNLTDADLAELNGSISSGLPATSLLALTGRPQSRQALLTALLEQIDEGILAAERGNSPQSQWQAQLAGIAQQVICGGVTGALVGVDQFGRILIDDGTQEHAIAVGDVSLRPCN